MEKTSKVIVALSGGVDSAVAAYLLKRQGYDCEGVTLKLFDNAPYPFDAENIAKKLEIPFRIIDAGEEFNRRVVNEFVNGYLNGGTPNPCVDCNRAVKFGLLWKNTNAELTAGADFFATGHYARIENGRLKRAADLSKDQSYVLYTLTREQLSRTFFPLGGLTKTEVRAIAAEQGFSVADKPESQDICFVPDGDYAKFIEARTGEISAPGNFVDENGGVLGRHNGLIRYTVGQRKGFGIAFKSRMFVSEKDAAENTVTLVEGGGLFSKSLLAEKVNWLIEPPKHGETLRLQAKTRYNQKNTARAEVSAADGEQIKVVFDEPQRAVARGQHVVLYDGDYVAGGGVIL